MNDVINLLEYKKKKEQEQRIDLFKKEQTLIIDVMKRMRKELADLAKQLKVINLSTVSVAAAVENADGNIIGLFAHTMDLLNSGKPYTQELKMLEHWAKDARKKIEENGE